jgi:peptide chain release factor
MAESCVTSEKRQALEARLAAVGVREQDIVEKFVLGTGKGGQKLNKTSSCVYLRHVPTGLEVKCQRERSRELNRFLARRELCDRIEARIRGVATARQEAAEKIRRQKRRRSRRQKERMVAEKRRHAEKKRERKAGGYDE